MNAESERACDARRKDIQSDKAKRWRLNHPTYDRDRRRKERAEFGRKEGDSLGALVNPEKSLKFESDNCMLTFDYHEPFSDADLFSDMLKTAKEYGTKDIAIPGDFMDCDNFKEFLGEPYRVTWQQELEQIKMRLQILVDSFERVFICRGNHEHRWLKVNGGFCTMQNLFSMTGINDGYEVTDDNYMIMNPRKNPWLLCHPRNFSAISLRVPTRLASKHHMNIASGHGHHFAQGWDDSGYFQVIEGGGMFAKRYIRYLRDISLYPEVCTGYYLVLDGIAYPYKGTSIGVLEI